MKTAALACALVLLAACGQSQQESPGTPAPSASAPSAAATNDQPDELVPPKSASELATERLEQTLAGDWRDGDTARDAFRHPRQTLEFFGIRPDMTVIEITPGGGWYAAILAPYLGESGRYIAATFSGLSSDYNRKSLDQLRAKFSADPAHYGKAVIVEVDPKTPNLGTPGSADMVLTFRNVHNWVMGDTAPQMFKAFHDVLAPGGVLGVVDHRAADGKDIDAVKGSGYLPQDYVVKLATDAGFVLDASSEINANPKDTKDYGKGVWTLPPTLTLGDTDKDRYVDIGESDRMTLRFIKPEKPAATATVAAATP